MTSVAEEFAAYRPDGTPVSIVVRHNWEPKQPGQREEREAFCLRHGFIVPTNSCAVACIMAAVNRGRRMTTILRVFTHEHNAIAVAEQEYEMAKEHVREVSLLRDRQIPTTRSAFEMQWTGRRRRGSGT